MIHLRECALPLRAMRSKASGLYQVDLIASLFSGFIVIWLATSTDRDIGEDLVPTRYASLQIDIKWDGERAISIVLDEADERCATDQFLKKFKKGELQNATTCDIPNSKNIEETDPWNLTQGDRFYSFSLPSKSISIDGINFSRSIGNFLRNDIEVHCCTSRDHGNYGGVGDIFFLADETFDSSRSQIGVSLRPNMKFTKCSSRTSQEKQSSRSDQYCMTLGSAAGSPDIINKNHEVVSTLDLFIRLCVSEEDSLVCYRGSTTYAPSADSSFQLTREQQ